MKEPPIYECADFFLIRHAHYPIQVLDSITREQDPIKYIFKFYENNALFKEAIAIANPDLHQFIKNLKSKNKKIFFSLLKYLSRTYSRATPFGLFSSVNWGVFHSKTELTFDISSIQKKARPSMEWVADLIDLYHSEKTFVRDLYVIANPQIILRSGRAIIIKNASIESRKNYNSIQNTEASETVFALAKTSIRYKDLEKKMITIYPNIEKSKIEEYLWLLFQKRYLLSELHMKTHSLPELTKITQRIPFQNLSDLSQSISAYENDSLSNDRIGKLEEVYTQMKNISKKVKFTLQVDAHCKISDVFLHKNVQKSIEKAANLLWLISHEEQKLDNLVDFYHHFLEKYGVNRLVPLSELLGEPHVYDFLLKQTDKKKKTNLIETFIFSQLSAKEIILDDIVQLLPKLTKEELQKAPPSIELLFELSAPSLKDINQGNFNLIILGMTPQAGNAFGRFLYLWDEAKVKKMQELKKKEESLHPEILFVETSFFPENPRFANICFCKKTRKYQLNIYGYNDSKNTLQLNDLYIGANAEQLYIYSKKLNKEIYTVLNSAINPDLAPFPLKFLLTLSRYRFSNFAPMLSSYLTSMLYFPRIRYQNIVFSPAQWYFNYQSLEIKTTDSENEIKIKLLNAFKKYDVPFQIYLTQSDNRLLINWKVGCFFDLIFQQFKSNFEIFLVENLIDLNNRVIKNSKGNYVSEFVVPLTKNRAYGFESLHTSYPQTKQLSIQDRISLPGGEWLYAKIFLPIEETEIFLQKTLFHYLNYLTEKYEIKKWFYVRYKEEDYHIRIRINAPHSILNSSILQDIHQWISHLLQSKLIHDFHICPYKREIERYGGPDSIDLVEEFFFIDTIYCSEILLKANKITDDIPIYIKPLFGIINILKHFYTDNALVLAFLTPNREHMNLLSGLRPYNRIIMQYTKFLFLEQIEENLPNSKGDIIKSLLSKTTNTLSSLAKKINDLEQAEMLWNTKRNILDSLIHMHCNRIIGFDKKLEIKARLAAHHFLSKSMIAY
ncbi:lantibiotic dehydratase [Candidatus Rhabdochlamydia porcellionis]|jgi:lantibiotic biosynthesis protein|uniref:Nisin biosynthesis protein NisB n=1 Tax=Candidatus Rhabdochlamydia porcellionis TaxID=225148 RepID=A0ABX8YYQ0_9BACT|nr:lantibiotic dehydratase [Candidatus Rhabdochlamydia porcellionis]QZA58450.1 Nisin biosynthesis protein NisB [Candidatus Rhabdochlamydia porcellionis]